MAQSAPVLNQTASANSQPTSITIPSGTAVGDLMVLAINIATTAGTVPSGWTQLVNQSFASNTIGSAVVCTRRAVTGDPGSTVTLPSGTRAAQLSTWSNVGSDSIVVGTPTATNATQTGGTGYTATASSVSTADANCTIVDLFFGLGSISSGTTITNTPTLTLPATTTQAATVGDSNGVTSYWWGVGVSYQDQAAAGSSTAETATWTPFYTSGATAGGVCGVQIALPPIQAPGAPTLTSPANASYEDMSGAVTLAWTYNPTQSDGAQNAIAIRRKISGAPSYSYWNASTSAWQSTIVWNSYTTGAYTFPTGAWANGNIYNWSVATQEATESLQSPFAADFTVTAQAVPSVALTAPTGTIQTTTPTVTGTISVASGASPTSYRVVVYTAAQVAASGFAPGTSVGEWDSGTVSTSATAISQAVPPNVLANNVSYYAYTMATETGGEASAWTSIAFTVSFDAPQTPTVAPTPAVDDTTGAPIIIIGVFGHDNLLSTVDASVEAASLGTHAAETNCNVAPTTGWAADGSDSIQMSATAAGDMSEKTAGGYAIQPNTRYSALATFHAETTVRAVKVGIIWKDGSGAEISRTYGSTVNDTTATAGAQATVTATSPSTAAEADIVAYVVAAGGAGENHDVDCFGVFPGTVTTWSRGGLVGSTTVDIWARTASTSGTADAQRPASTGTRIAASVAQDSAQHAAWTDWAAGSGIEYEYQAVVDGPGGIATSSVWTS